MGTRAARLRRYAVRMLIGVAILLVAVVAWNGVKVWSAWRSIERVDFDLEESRAIVDELANAAPGEQVGEPTDPAQAEIYEPGVAQTVLADERVDVFLMVGTDEGRPGDDLGRADAVLLFIRPEGGLDPVLVSLPRDLSLVNPCTRQPARLTTTLEGCGSEVSGPELLALMVENFTTLSVDHFAIISFEAFTGLIDRLDGVEVCVDYDTRLDMFHTLPAGCSIAEGKAALAWLRSRVSEELVDGEWRAADIGDLARSQRQQQLLVQLLGRLRGFRSPTGVASLVGDLADSVVLDARLSMGAAIDIAWEMRNINPAAIQRPVLPVEDQVLRGKFVRVPTQPFPELLAQVYATS